MLTCLFLSLFPPPSLCSVTSPSLLFRPPHLSSLIGDPGHHRTAQAKQRNIQQSVQQLLLPGRWPCPWVTGQSRSPSTSQSVRWSVGGVLWNESWQAIGTPNEFIIVCFLSARTALHLWMGVVSYTPDTRIKKLFLLIPDSCTLWASCSRTLSWPNRESSSQSVYKTLMDLLWPTLGWLELDAGQT